MMDPMQSFRKLVAEAKKNIKELTVAEVAEKLKKGEKFTLVDVREGEEWRKVHAQGAIHISRGVLERDIGEDVPDAYAPIVLYCGGGSNSALAAETLQKMGYKNVYSMDGGMRGWIAAGLPTEEG